MVVAGGIPRAPAGGSSAAGGSSSAAYVFTEPAGGWSGAMHESARLVASDGAVLGQYAIAASGDTIVAGAPGAEVDGESVGAAYVFTMPDGGWSGTLNETARLTASDLTATGDLATNLGWTVALSGNTVLATDAPQSADPPRVYVFSEPSGGWRSETQNAELVASTGRLDGYPPTILPPAMSGRTIAVPGLDGAGPAVFVYNEPSSGWTGTVSESARLEGAVAPLAISGATILAGGFGAVSGSTLVGKGPVLLFDEPAGGWSGVRTPDGQLAPALNVPGGEGVYVESPGGWSSEGAAATVVPSGGIDLARMWNVSVAGATAAVADASSGTVLVYDEPAGGWATQAEVATLEPPPGAQGFGAALAVGEGFIAVAAGNDVYVYDEPAGGWAGELAPNATLFGGANRAPPSGAVSVAIAGSAIVVGDSHTVTSGTGTSTLVEAVSVFDEPPGGWAGTPAASARLAPPHGEDLVPVLAASGPTIAVVGSGRGENGLPVYLYTEPHGGWAGSVAPAAEATPGHGVTGGPIALSGSTLFAAASQSPGCHCDNARVFVFRRPAGGWRRTVHDTARLVIAGVGSLRALAAAGRGLIAATQGSCDPMGNCFNATLLSFTEPAEGWSGRLLTSATSAVGAPPAIAESGTSALLASGGPQVTIDSIPAASTYQGPFVAVARTRALLTGSRRIVLAFAAAAGAPRLTSFQIVFPRGVSLIGRQVRSWFALRFLSLGVGRHSFKGTLVNASRTIHLEILPQELRLSAGLRRTLAHRGRHPIRRTMEVTLGDASGNTLALEVRLRLNA